MIDITRLKHLAPGTLCLIFFLSLAAADHPAQTRNSSLLLRQAETTARQIVQQFHTDLDFKRALDRNFVSDPKLRLLAMPFDDEEKWKQFDQPTRERTYVALMTFIHLWAEYTLIQHKLEVPPEIDRDKDLILISSNAPKTLAELNRGIAELEEVSNLYRKYFPKGVFESAQYRTSVGEIVTDAKTNHDNVPRIDKGNARFGIPETVSVYVVRPEAFDYYFIRENGAMKLFYVDILPNFKLF